MKKVLQWTKEWMALIRWCASLKMCLDVRMIPVFNRVGLSPQIKYQLKTCKLKVDKKLNKP